MTYLTTKAENEHVYLRRETGTSSKIRLSYTVLSTHVLKSATTELDFLK